MPSRVRLALLSLLFLPLAASGQTVVKYGAEFLASGVGARALGMGGAYVAHADDVTAGYWNVAGLDAVVRPEGAYMHAERFDGAVSFDYAAVAYPISERSTIGVSFVRSAVDDIANTLDALDPATGLPRPDAADFISYFSAADNALFLSYARGVSNRLSVGASAKVVRRGIGDFASAWSYSLDVGAQLDLGNVQLGLTVQDATGMVQAWSVDAARFEQLAEESRPVGLTEIVLPLARLGAATTRALSDDVGLTLAADLDLAFDGQQANALNAGDVSFRPRVGSEFVYRDVLAFRAGIADVTTNERFGTQITPSVGTGVRLGALSVDYGFGDFGGLSSELGYSHRVSLAYRFGGERMAEPDGGAF
ncbi:MAG: PorV/PorQ family protein [Bacteroidota bacterium]